MQSLRRNQSCQLRCRRRQAISAAHNMSAACKNATMLMHMMVSMQQLAAVADCSSVPQGLFYIPDALARQEEQAILEGLDAVPASRYVCMQVEAASVWDMMPAVPAGSHSSEQGARAAADGCALMAVTP
jgi:hypothetical protein